MIKRTLYFGNPAYLSLRDRQLVIDFPGTDEQLMKAVSGRTIPIEDIGVIILDHRQITITHACIGQLLENNVALISCDSQHLPTGLMLNLNGHSHQNERVRKQIEASEPLKKVLWQQTIKAKIKNQAQVLSNNSKKADNLFLWASKVRSGDPDNYEARTAVYYWKNLFPDTLQFNRSREGSPPNQLLNYGYSIVRALVARALVASGLLPIVGIHHQNKYNAYCLADDIMEPYRPFVDQKVLQIVHSGEDFSVLNSSLKAQMLTIVTDDVLISNERSPLFNGVHRTTASLAKCFEGTARKILYPEIPVVQLK